jgi:WD40 repeat protein
VEAAVEKIKVLVFAASPRGTDPLDLEREFREIEEEVRRATYREAVELILIPGARPVDLLRKLNENRPQVVHFSSHGNPAELVLESGEESDEFEKALVLIQRSQIDRDMILAQPGKSTEACGRPIDREGSIQRVGKSALARVLRACDEGNLRLVVLNACQSRTQAEELSRIVDCVVSMNREITDRAAAKFAASFYGALAFGRSVQNAFDQGVARLTVECTAEADTPELVVRAGLDASRLILISERHPGEEPAKQVTESQAPFIVPFPRNRDFVGREEDLLHLHRSLSGPGLHPVGIRPAGLTGMGGIGKTQLAVEYVFRNRDGYPDGIFWIDAAGPLSEGFSRLATDHRLGWAGSDLPRDQQIRAAFEELSRRTRGLLVLDNVPVPAVLAAPVVPECVPEDLPCRVLFTTRWHDLGRFTGVEVTVLSEVPALRLLCRHPSRLPALDPVHREHEHARAIARMLGRLPLALELAGAYLGKFSGDVTLADYRAGLRSDGALATIDADAAELSEAHLRRVHDPAVAATIGEQWASLEDDSARLVLGVAAMFPESRAVPISQIGLLSGLSDDARPGRLSPLRRAIKRLEDACLIERLEAAQLRLHLLVREFARRQTPAGTYDAFRSGCLLRAAGLLEHYPTFESLHRQRGVDAAQEDMIALHGLCAATDAEASSRLHALLRLLQREAHILRGEPQEEPGALFTQQVRNRAFLENIDALRSGADAALDARGHSFFRLLWKANRESPALARTIAGHHGFVTAVAITPDGQQLVSGSDDGTIALWDLTTGRLLLSFHGHEAEISGLVVTAPGEFIVSAAYDRTVKCWDLTSGRLVSAYTGHEDWVSALALGSDARTVLSGALDGALHLWDLVTGKLIARLPEHDDAVTAVAMVPGRQLGLSSSADCTVIFWDLKRRKTIDLLAEGNVPTAMAVTASGSHALVGAVDGNLKIWDLATGRLAWDLPGHRNWITSVAVTTDYRLVVTGSRDGTLKLWDPHTGVCNSTLAGHDDRVNSIALTPDNRSVVSGSSDRTIKLWDLEGWQGSAIPSGHESRVSSLAITPDGRQALSGSSDLTLRLWDVQSGQLLRTFTGNDVRVTSVAITPDGRRALSSSLDDSELVVWDLARGKRLKTFHGHENWISSVTLTPDGRWAITGSCDCTLGFWDLEAGQLVRLRSGHEAPVTSLAAAPDGQRVVSGSSDRTLKVWNIHTGAQKGTFLGHQARIRAIVVTSYGRQVISGADDRTLRLWDLDSRTLIATLEGHEGHLTSLAATPDGRFAVSGAYDRTLRLWNLESRQTEAIVPVESVPFAIALSPDGRSLVVGDVLGNLHCFTVQWGCK